MSEDTAYSTKQASQAYCAELNRRLQQTEPMRLFADMGTYLHGITGSLEFSVRPYAAPIGHRSRDPHAPCTAIVFDVKANRTSKQTFIDLIRTEPLTRYARGRIRGKFHGEFGCAPHSLEEALESFETDHELFQHLLGWFYHLEYRPQNKTLSLKYAYSGAFAGQGLMTGLFERVNTAIDFNTIDAIKIPTVVEEHTTSLITPTPEMHNGRLCQKLKRVYGRSPFLRLLNRFGYNAISISSIDNEHFDISAQPADELIFTYEEALPESLEALTH